MAGPELNDAVPGTVHGVEGCHQRGKGPTVYGKWAGEPRARRFVIGFQDHYTEGQWLSQHDEAGQNQGAGITHIATADPGRRLWHQPDREAGDSRSLQAAGHGGWGPGSLDGFPTSWMGW